MDTLCGKTSFLDALELSAPTGIIERLKLFLPKGFKSNTDKSTTEVI